MDDNSPSVQERQEIRDFYRGCLFLIVVPLLAGLVVTIFAAVVFKLSIIIALIAGIVGYVVTFCIFVELGARGCLADPDAPVSIRFE